MSRVQLALRVADLEASIRFYRSLFGVEPAKRRPGYANFAVAEPPLKLVLLEGGAGGPTVMDHLGVEVESSAEVDEATARLDRLGLFTQVEGDTTCCYARQDKVWVHGPGREPWEVYTVTADSPVYGADGVVTSTAPVDDALACTLAGPERGARAEQWRTALAGVTARESVPGGVRATFAADTAVGELAELCVAEAACCRFFSFTLSIGPPVQLEVRAPEEARGLVHELFGEPDA